MTLQPLNIGIIGLGTVGCGTVNVLTRNAQEISRRVGRRLQVTHAAVKDQTKRRSCTLEGITLTPDPFAVVNDASLDIIVEVMGGVTTARELILTALKQGKAVITANKALIAQYGNEIFATAKQYGAIVAFEAAVGGGIPIIKVMREGLGGNRIDNLAGIINGTSNFILTEMAMKGRSFAEALMQAQKLGYAEADPTFDIAGIDIAHKLTILASIAFGIPLQLNNAYVEGINNITALDIAYAKEFGYRIKQLAIAKRTTQGIELRVHPVMLPERFLLAHVDGVMNAIYVQADAVGPTLYYGAGAGAEPTASAVVADLIEVARNISIPAGQRVPFLAFEAENMIDLPVLPISAIETPYYLRMRMRDKAGVFADVARILATFNISIEALLQKEAADSQPFVSVVVFTHRVREVNITQAIEQIEALDDIDGKIMRIRIEHL